MLEDSVHLFVEAVKVSKMYSVVHKDLAGTASIGVQHGVHLLKLVLFLCALHLSGICFLQVGLDDVVSVLSDCS